MYNFVHVERVSLSRNWYKKVRKGMKITRLSAQYLGGNIGLHFKEVLCEDDTILWISKFCACVSVRRCFIELLVRN